MNAQAYTTSSIIVRKLNNTPAVFVLSGLDLDRNVIPMWDGTSNEPTVVSLQMYKDSKPARDDETDMWAARFRERFLPTGMVQIRSRIAKDMAKMYADHAKQKENQPHQPEGNILQSPANIAAQQREASPEEATKPRLTMQEWEKRVLIERMTNAATKAFSEAMTSMMHEIMK